MQEDVNYTLYLSDSSYGFESFDAGFDTFYTVGEGAVEDGFYMWWVIAIWDADSLQSHVARWFVLGEPPPPPPHFGLISPGDGETITSLPVTFIWETLESDPALNITYSLEIISRDSSAGDPPWSFDVGEDTFYTLDGGVLVNECDYYWYVVAYVDGGRVVSDDWWLFHLMVAEEPLIGDEKQKKSSKFEILSVYPNLFNPVTQILISVPQAGRVNVEVFDILGRKVATLMNGKIEAGNHYLSWTGHGPSGTYLLRVSHENGRSDVRRLMFVR